MKIGFFIAHPSQYYIFREISKRLSAKHKIFSFYSPKDVLDELMHEDSCNSIVVRINQSELKKLTKINITKILLQKEYDLFKNVRKIKPDVLIGTSVIISHIGFLLHIPSIIFTEDDIDVISDSAKIGYPFCHAILSPHICDLSRFENKKIGYDGYQKLIYLNPTVFKFDRSILKKYGLEKGKYIIMRFSALQAHHDLGKKGISESIADRIVATINSKYRLVISSEKHLSDKYEKYRLKIKANEIHHVLSGASMLISDSQSMSVEASLLGVPSIRISDFVYKISVLNELESKYKLTFGFRPDDIDNNYSLILALNSQ